jgi:hypothetical protein
MSREMLPKFLFVFVPFKPGIILRSKHKVQLKNKAEECVMVTTVIFTPTVWFAPVKNLALFLLGGYLTIFLYQDYTAC